MSNHLIMVKDINNPLIHEEGRELGGLLIILLWLFACRFTSIGSSAPRAGYGKAPLLVTLVLGCLPLAVWGLCFVEGLGHLGHCTDMFPGMLGRANTM